jgi:F420-non-reducing hydrogenase iron-sulfur subunit
MIDSRYDPKIIGFVCNWCCYAGADLAGVSRLQYAPGIRLIRVMCSSRVSTLHILKALQTGIDGVLVGGCHPGECHYVNGNHYTERRIAAVKALLMTIGLEPERVKLAWVSASEGSKFADVVNEFTETTKRLGPNPLRRM